MAITRAQQAKQMLQDGGMLVKPGNGKRPGYRGDDAAKADRARSKGRNTSRADERGGVDRGGSGDAGNRFTQFTKEVLNPQVDTFQQAYKEPGLFGFGGGYRDLNVASDTSKGFKRGIGSRILGGIFGAINPALGFAFNTLASAPKTFQKFKDSPTLEAFRDNLRGYGRTRPTIFNNPNLDLMIDEEDNDTQFSTEDGDITKEKDVTNFDDAMFANALTTPTAGKFGLNLVQYNRLKNNRYNDSQIKEAIKGGYVNELLGTLALATGGRVGLMEGGIMNPDIVGGEFDFESARQMYGLGKLVKKVTRTVKKIAKSPIGKAAIIGGLTFGIPGVQSGFFSKGLMGTKTGLGVKNFLANKILGTPVGDFGTTRTGGLLDMIGGKIGAGIIGTSLAAGFLTPAQEEEAQQIADETGIDIAEIRANPNKYLATRFMAEGGSTEKEPVAKKTMPLLDMDGKEMDLRAEGGFVPIGRMEKADDVPARLSKNEFVFTADAVRNAGDGDVDKGAEVMYNMMKNLESGGEVSEESQGLEGARKMFQTSQRLEEVL